MRRLSVGLIVGCWAVAGCRTASVPQPPSAPEAVARGATPEDEADHLHLAAEHLDRADEAGALPHLKAHLRQHPDSLMVRAYLGELLMKTGDASESKIQFERFAREAGEVAGPAQKHLVHVHTRLMELAGRADDAFEEQLHRGIGLVLLVRHWDEEGELADPAQSERTLVQAAKALKLAGAEKPGDARVWLYLAETRYGLDQPSAARESLMKASRCQPEWTLNPHERERLEHLRRVESLGG